MDDLRFLEDIYFGFFDSKRFNSFKDLEEDEEVIDIVQKYLELSEKYPPHYLEQEGKVPEEVFEKLGEIGFFGLNIPKEYGGMDLNIWQYLKVVSEVASQDMALAILFLAHLSIGTKGIVLFGNEEQKRRYLTPAASGEMIFAFALTEPSRGSDAKNIETMATLSEDGTHYTLNGQKTYITNANYAGALTVFSQMDSGNLGAFIVDASWEGVSIGKDMPKMGLKASSTAAIVFKDVRVPVENLLGQPGDGFKIAMHILNYGRLALGAASTGIMNQSLQDMLKRSASRIQFGVPINHYELIQEKMVKAKVYGYVASAMTAFTAGMLADDPLAHVPLESSHCKLFGTTRAWDTLYDAQQVAGGSGYLASQPYEKRMRDFRVAPIFEGTTEIHSIYPALYALRNLSKRLETLGRNKILELAYLARSMFGMTHWKLQFADRTVKKAVRLVRSNARRLRYMLAAGTLLYGESILQKEFFLRRVTNLSLYLYGIISVLAKVEEAKKNGRNVAQDLMLLAFFVEEARESRKLNKRFFSSGREKIHNRIIKNITA
jgi:acyl-CoA dehydrogenase family protein 9